MGKYIELPVTAITAVPFRAWVQPFRAAISCSGDNFDSQFELRYNLGFDVDSRVPSMQDVSQTVIILDTRFPYPKDAQEPDVVWFGRNGVEIVDEVVLPRINEFLLRIRRSLGNRAGSDVFRAVGALDLMLVNLQFRERGVFMRVNPTSMSNLPGLAEGEQIDPALLSLPVPHEWGILIRATDLINHGYFLEGFVTGFALLDASVQDLLKELLAAHGFTQSQSNDLLRSIEADRLRRYLDLLLPLMGIESPLRDTSLKTELAWLNTTRNRVLHAGRSCSLAEAQRGLTAVLTLLNSLNACGGKYQLPDHLPFWST